MPAELSLSAGSFVCNHVFYGLMHALETDKALRSVREGFVYVPSLLSQGVPSLSLADTCAVCGQRWHTHGSMTKKRMRCTVLAIKDGSAMSQQWRFY